MELFGVRGFSEWLLWRMVVTELPTAALLLLKVNAKTFYIFKYFFFNKYINKINIIYL